MKKKIIISISTILIISIAAGVYVWFVLRPEQIKTNCELEAENKINRVFAQDASKDFDNLPEEEKNSIIEKFGSLDEGRQAFVKLSKTTAGFTEFRQKNQDNLYGECLRENGLEKEADWLEWQKLKNRVEAK